MVYNARYLSGPFYGGSEAASSLWILKSDAANLAAIVASDYVTDGALRGMQVGDIVIVLRVTTYPNTTPLGIAHMYVLSIDVDDNVTLDDIAIA